VIDRLFHLAVPDDWQAAVARGGPYEMSTRGLTLEAAGYIHLSYRHQVPVVAERFYADIADPLVLTIEPGALTDEVRVENLEGGSELFPHLYGPLPLYAVVAVAPLSTWSQADRRS
jgi:glutathione S-transferase